MQRVTITMSDSFADELNIFMQENAYTNRSEALRDLAQAGLDRDRTQRPGAGQCLANLLYVFDHSVRDLPKRLTESYHDHHELAVATMHVHLDHDNCLEVAVLRGGSAAVKEFARGVIAERGVRHGQVTFIPVEIEEAEHKHGDSELTSRHDHVIPIG